jgi:FkbM family methyltransferase
MTEVEATLLRYPGIARARLATAADGATVAQVLPWGRPGGAPDTGALAELAQINASETRFLHDEIFLTESYLQNGVLLRSDAVVFDVGANIGMFALFVAARCPSAHVFAFEPVPEVYAVLAANVESRGISAELFPYGLSDRAGEVRFNYYPGISIMSCRSDYAAFDNERQLLKLYVEHARESGPPGREEHLANVEALLEREFEWADRVCALRRTSAVIAETGVPRIDLLKIDVQRAELDVLLGIDDRHWPLVQQVVMEVHDETGNPTAGRLPTVVDLLTDKGFHVTATEPDMLAGTGRFAVTAIRPEYAADPRPVAAAAGAARPLDTEEVRAWLATALPAGRLPDRVEVVTTMT